MSASGDLGDLDVLDMTEDPYLTQEDEGDGNRIRLHSGIDVQQLLRQNDGVIFEPEIDESLFHPRLEDRNYFHHGAEDFDNIISKMRLQEEEEAEEDDDNLSPFENKARRMVNLTEDGGIKKKIIVKGLEGEGKPPSRGTVTIHYSLYLEGQDEPYDSTVLRSRPERYRLDDGRLLEGLELAVKSMMKHETAEFLIEHEYAFGKLGCPPRVPGEAQILARVEMINFVQEEATDALLSMAPEDRKKLKTFADIASIARAENQAGNDFVKTDDFKAAVRRYEKAIRLMEDAELKDDEEEKVQKRMLNKYYLNCAHCSIKIHRPKRACIDLQKALQIDPRNPKALYRMAKAKRMLGHMEDARRYLLKAQHSAPNDTDIGKELASVDRQIQKELSDRKALCRRMFPGALINKNEDMATFDVDDDFYQDMAERLQTFKNDETEFRLPLPTSLGKAEIDATRYIAKELGLIVEKTNAGGSEQSIVVKPPKK